MTPEEALEIVQKRLANTIPEIDRDTAIAMAQSSWWDLADHSTRVRFQWDEKLLAMDFSAFHESLEKELGRPVFTHEIGPMGRGQITKELAGEAGPATLGQRLAPLDREKTIIIVQTD